MKASVNSLIEYVLFATLCTRFVTSVDRFGMSLLKGSEVQRKEFNQTFPGCWLGNNFYMVGDKWSPHIEPRGVMDCVKCQCAQVVKRNIVQLEGKVLCRNIRRECPQASCVKPRLRPNTCCKVCDDEDARFEDQFSDIGEHLQVIQPTQIVQTDNKQDWVALLTGSDRRSRQPIKTRAVSYLRINNITGNAFKYYVRFSRLKHPLSLRFEDRNGSILIDASLPVGTKRKGKVEGEVRDVPTKTMVTMLQGKVWCTITTIGRKDGEISGRLSPDPIDTQPLFEAVLSPTTKTGNGGYLALYHDSHAPQMSYVAVLDDQDASVTGSDFYVTIEKDTEIIYQHLLRLSDTENKLIGRLRPDRQMSKQLARGRLHGRVTSRKGEVITGVIRPRLLRSDVVAFLSLKEHNITGYMVGRLQENGAFTYKLWTDGSPVSYTIVVQRSRGDARKWKTFLKINTNESKEGETGAFSMTDDYKKLKIDDVAAILDGEVRVQLRKGDMTTHSYFKRRQATNIDFIKDVSVTLQSPVCVEEVVAWYRVSVDCAVYLYLEHPSGYSEILAQSIVLSTGSDTAFGGESQEFHVDNEQPEVKLVDVSAAMLQGMNDGAASIHVYTENKRCEVWKSPFHLPNTCWRPEDIGSRLNEFERNDNVQYTCFHEGKFYHHGDTWIPDHSNNCVTCRCQKGSTYCDDVLCPPTTCARPVTRPGACCRVCEEDNETEQKSVGSCFYHGDKRWHSFGTFWHPYVPPFGYSRCSLCTCLPDTGGVNCSRLACPPLDCPVYHRVRVNRDDCCQMCQVPVQTNHRSENCQFGTSTYNHGDKWHPVLTPFGEMTCYICSCKNGKIRCRKKKCPLLHCKKQYRPAGQCCPVCAESKQKRRSKGKQRSFLRLSNQQHKTHITL